VRLDNTFPPLFFVPGHTLNHEAKCFSLGHRLKSRPVSASNRNTVSSLNPGTRNKSTPTCLYISARTSNPNSAFFFVPPPLGGTATQ
jgi:hypothetical protein